MFYVNSSFEKLEPFFPRVMNSPTCNIRFYKHFELGKIDHSKWVNILKMFFDLMLSMNIVLMSFFVNFKHLFEVCLE